MTPELSTMAVDSLALAHQTGYTHGIAIGTAFGVFVGAMLGVLIVAVLRIAGDEREAIDSPAPEYVWRRPVP